ncbi:MAG: molecular chaperone [Acidiferrobacterales bacterium]
MTEQAVSANKNADMHGGMEATAEDAARANTYALLGSLLAAPPSREVLTLLTQIDVAADDGANDMAAAWAALRLAGERAGPSDLEEEYHELFVGLGRGEIVPYGSWYMTGFIMDRPLGVLRQDLAALGFERQEDIREPEDHAGALCETMSMIVSNGEAVGFDTQRKFFQDHIGPWMERFFRDLQNAKAARFYRAVGQFGEQFMALEKRYLAMLV